MIRRLNNEEFSEIYNQYMQYDFPDNELKSLNMLLNTKEACFYGLDEDGIKGYGVILCKGNYAILDYLGTVKEYRQKGYGSKLLQGIMEEYADYVLIIESEIPYDEVSQKRITFYLKNKLILSPVDINLYYVDYHILTNQNVDASILNAIYHTFYPDAFCERYLKIIDNQDDLSQEGIQKYLHTNCDVHVVEETTSTNTVTMSKAREGEKEGYILIAKSQTQGKGRVGHRFYSPTSTGIYMSILLRPENLEPSDATNITSLAAVSACEAIKQVFHQEAGIKWINDIFVEGKKTCGILVESSINLESKKMEFMVMGIGLNVYEPEGGFPADIVDIAGAISKNRIPDGRNKLAAAFIDSFMHYYHLGDKSAYYQTYKDLNFVLGKEITVTTLEGTKKVLAKDIDENFELVVIEKGIEKTLSSGIAHIKL